MCSDGDGDLGVENDEAVGRGGGGVWHAKSAGGTTKFIIKTSQLIIFYLP